MGEKLASLIQLLDVLTHYEHEGYRFKGLPPESFVLKLLLSIHHTNVSLHVYCSF